MARQKNMHTDLQISSCWEHISTWNMHAYLSRGTTVYQMNFQGNIFFTQNWCNITLRYFSFIIGDFVDNKSYLWCHILTCPIVYDTYGTLLIKTYGPVWLKIVIARVLRIVYIF